MAAFDIHKGVDAPVEFKGLRSQYLFICAGGLIGSFLLIVAMNMVGFGHVVCLFTGVAMAVGVVTITFRLNDKYGTFGLMKAFSVRLHPRRITNRRCVQRLICRGNV